jgi:hypothetical protein
MTFVTHPATAASHQHGDKELRNCSERIVGQQEVGNSAPECCSVSDNWRLGGTQRRSSFRLMLVMKCSRLLRFESRPSVKLLNVLIGIGAADHTLRFAI